MNEVRQDEEKGYRERKTRNGYKFIGINKNGKDVYAKDGNLYREEDYQYLVKTEMEELQDEN